MKTEVRQPANGYNALFFILIIIGIMYTINYWAGVSVVAILATLTLLVKKQNTEDEIAD